MKLLNWTLLILLVSLSTRVSAQKVPTYMEFADVKLKITEGAKREIQKDVDMLTRSPKYFGIKVNRANLYFPIIERIFKKQGLPDDFKYLVLQESALIPDAVSSSNAIGFWQFKKAAAKEVGLRVDGVVDERMNIVSASTGAAKYLKKYNTLFFKNWLYTLQSYNVGPGGALRSLDKKKYGSKRMIVDKKTHWYVKKYLSHKIAFEPAINHRNATKKLAELTDNSLSSLKDINKKYGVEVDVLKNYNKWLKGRKIPDDKTYTVVIPVDNSANKHLAALVNNKSKPFEKSRKPTKNKPVTITKLVAYDVGTEFPVIRKKVLRKTGLSYTQINGIPGMVAREKEGVNTLAERGGISAKKFRAYNDLSRFDKIIPGQVYYFKKKKTKAKIHHYGAKRNESLWAISQKFGVRLDKLLSKNRMLSENNLKAGRVLWLRYNRPDEEPVEFIDLPDEKIAEKVPIIVKNTVTKDQQNRSLTTPEEDRDKNKPETGKTILPIAEPEKTDQKSEIVASEEIWEDDSENEKWLNEEAAITENESTSQQEPQLNIIDRKNPSPIDEFEVDESPKFINTSVPSATIENGRKMHVIKQGETLFSIARTYDITVQDLKTWNNLEDMSNIKFDQKLIVGQIESEDNHVQNTQPQSASQAILLHEVEEGDTIFSISKSYNMPIEKIMELNQKTDYNIAIGEKLKIVKTK